MNGFVKATKSFSKIFVTNGPHIMTAFGCVGVFTTAILAVKATPKALLLLDEYRAKHDELSKLDAVKITWKEYVPAGIAGVLSVGCIIGSNAVNTKRNAALAAVCALSEKAFREYQSKVIETIGKNKENKIRDEVVGDRLKQASTEKKEVIFTGNGNVLCYDTASDRLFESNCESIRKSINDFNNDLMSEMSMSLNELYYRLGLKPTGLGEMINFDIDKGLVIPRYSSHLDDLNRPCFAIDLEDRIKKELPDR